MGPVRNGKAAVMERSNVRLKGLSVRHADVPSVRAWVWALRADRSARRSLRRGGLAGLRVPDPPPLPDQALRGVRSVLARTGASCLVRAAVLQAWERAHGRHRDLVIGVTAPSTGFRAHAWLDGDDPCHAVGFTELIRRAS